MPLVPVKIISCTKDVARHVRSGSLRHWRRITLENLAFASRAGSTDESVLLLTLCGDSQTVSQ